MNNVKFIVAVYCQHKKRIKTLQFDNYIDARRSLNSTYMIGENWTNKPVTTKWVLVEKLTSGKHEYIKRLISENQTTNWCFELASFEYTINNITYRKQATISLSI